MAQVIVRDIEESVKQALKRRAKQHGWSMEEEARRILHQAVLRESTPAKPLGTRIANRFKGCGLDDDLSELRGGAVEPMQFDK